MHRIDNQYAVTSMPAIGAPGVNPNSYFKRVTSGKATLVSIDFLNSLQEEICYTIEQCEINLSKTDQSQLLQAINYLKDLADIPPPSGESGTLDVNNYNIISSTSYIEIISIFDIDLTDDTTSAVTLDIIPNDNPVLGGDLTGFFLNETISAEYNYLLGFLNDADFINYPTTYDKVALTYSAIFAMSTFYTTYGRSQIFFGGFDQVINHNSMIYFWDGLPTISPFSIYSAYTLLVNIVRLDIWVDIGPGIGESFEFRLFLYKTDKTTIILVSGPLIISGSNAYGFIDLQEPPLINYEIGYIALRIVTSSGAATLNRISYRLKLNNMPLY